ncbi:MAG: hypothetical protein MJZ34_07970 [Paludibacteraceae bacterium]|nr:hypothetical protein [Paludibacteraceae bacterium]
MRTFYADFINNKMVEHDNGLYVEIGEVLQIQQENERLKNQLEQSEFWERSWREKCEKLEEEIEKLKHCD